MNSTSNPPQSLFPQIRLLSWQGIILILLVLLVLATLAFVIFQPIQVLPRIRLAPGFLLYDQDGQPLSNEDLRGQFVLYNFSTTTCLPDACPETERIMQEVQRRMGKAQLRGLPVSQVTILLDSDTATPEALAAYAAAWQADTSTWKFVSGDAQTLKNVVGSGFEVYYEQGEDGSYRLNPTILLVDGWGIVRGIYNSRSIQPNTDHILRHLEVLATEVQNSKGVAKAGYEAAHLFLCYAS